MSWDETKWLNVPFSYSQQITEVREFKVSPSIDLNWIVQITWMEKSCFNLFSTITAPSNSGWRACKYFEVFLSNALDAGNEHLFICSSDFSHSVTFYVLYMSPLYRCYLPWGFAQIVWVKQVDVIPSSEQKTASLLIQQQRVGVQDISRARKQIDTSSLKQFWSKTSKRQTGRLKFFANT